MAEFHRPGLFARGHRLPEKSAAGRGRWRPVRLCVVAAGLLLGACSQENVVGGAVISEGVSLELAQDRALRLSGLHYRLAFDIPADDRTAIAGRASIQFELDDVRAPVQLDYRQPADTIRALTLNGAAVEFEVLNEHIVVPPSGLRRGRNDIAVEFIAGDSSLNRKPEFLYTLFVPDRARTAFPLFDQPDLKAIFELTLEVPTHWQALANAPLLAREELGAERARYRFAPTEPISSYLFSFVSGQFQAVTRQVNGRSMTMLHRETDAAKVARNIDDIFALHGDAIAWMENYTGTAYPFAKFDFVLIPDFPYGGMEHVGAIQYRASSLLLDEAPPLTERLGRAQLIAHETAHMWFGNLVTMRWFDDVWTKEVFANFMADKIVNPIFPKVDHGLNFLLNHYPGAYAVDRSGGANPIRQPLDNLNQAGQLYGGIIYHKAPIMMRQLELLVGADTLREGLGEYLRRFAYANASWPELIAILDARSAVDLAAWSQVWVETSGRPEFTLVDDPVSGSSVLRQRDPAGRERLWPQQFDLLTQYAGERVQRTPLVVVGEETPLPHATASGPAAARLFNASGLGYGLFPENAAWRFAWERLRPVERGSLLVNAYEQLLEGAADSPGGYLAVLLDRVQREQNPLLLKLALDQMVYVYQSLLLEPRQRELRADLEAQLWSAVLAQPDSSRTRLVFRYYAALASSPTGLDRLYALWSREAVLDRLTLEEEDLLELAAILAIRLPERAKGIIARQLANTDNPDRRERFAFLAPSLSADPAVRDQFFESLRDERNRQTENWVGLALANLHHPARLKESEKYIGPSLELLEEIQITGDIFFPSTWLEATLGTHHSPGAARTVREFLARRPDYNPQLRMKILQAADGLFRAVAIREAGEGDREFSDKAR